jgi:hypothetical protein
LRDHYVDPHWNKQALYRRVDCCKEDLRKLPQINKKKPFKAKTQKEYLTTKTVTRTSIVIASSLDMGMPAIRGYTPSFIPRTGQ